MQPIVKVNNLLEYTESGQRYSDGTPVLSPTAEASQLAQSIGWQVIHAWALAAGDKTTEDAAIELYNDFGSGIPDSTDPNRDFMTPFQEILEFINAKLADKGYDLGVQHERANNLLDQQAALGL